MMIPWARSQCEAMMTPVPAEARRPVSTAASGPLQRSVAHTHWVMEEPSLSTSS